MQEPSNRLLHTFMGGEPAVRKIETSVLRGSIVSTTNPNRIVLPDTVGGRVLEHGSKEIRRSRDF